MLSPLFDQAPPHIAAAAARVSKIKVKIDRYDISMLLMGCREAISFGCMHPELVSDVIKHVEALCLVPTSDPMTVEVDCATVSIMLGGCDVAIMNGSHNAQSLIDTVNRIESLAQDAVDAYEDSSNVS
jgi:hypothetical protein